MANWQLYCITSPSGKRYFGITGRSVSSRWHGHCHRARLGSTAPLHRAIRKYGTNSFSLTELVVGPRDYIHELEVKAISAFCTQDMRLGYNLSAGGEFSTLGLTASAETRAKLSAASMGRSHSHDAKEKIRAANSGRVFSKSHSANISAAKKGKPGRPWSEAMRLKMNAREKYVCSEETKEKLRASHLGLKHTAEMKNKVTLSLLGNTRAKGKTWKWRKNDNEQRSSDSVS